MALIYSVTKDLEIVTSCPGENRPADDQVLARFAAERTAIPFNPMTFPDYDYIDDQRRLNAIAKLKAKNFCRFCT